MTSSIVLYGPDDRPMTAERRYEYLAPTSLQNKSDIYSIFGYGPTETTAKITEQKALTISPWFRAMFLISSYVAKLPCVLSKRVDGGKERDAKHPAYSMLLYKPNAEMTSLSFFQTIQYLALARGNGIAYIDRDRSTGEPVELYPLNQEWVTLYRKDGQLWYIIEMPDLPKVRAPADDVIHIKGLGSNGVWGFDVLTLAAASLSVGSAAQDYTWKYFKNGAMPGVVLQHPSRFKDAQKLETLRRSWEEMYTGLDNAHKTAILEEGMEAKTLSFNAKDSQLEEMLGRSAIDVSNWTGVPPHKLGNQDRAAYNSLEQENQSFLDDCLDFWLRNWEMELRDKLLTERQKREDTHVIEFTRQALVRADLTARYAAYKIGREGGWLSANMILAKENENGIGPQGDVFMVPLNMVSADKVTDAAPDENNPPIEPVEDDERSEQPDANNVAVMQVLESHAIGKIMRRIGTQAVRASKHSDTFGEFLTEAVDKNIESAVDAMYPVLCANCRMVGPSVMELADDAAKNALRWAVKQYRDIWTNAPGSQFETTIKDRTDKLAADAVSAKLLEWRGNE